MIKLMVVTDDPIGYPYLLQMIEKEEDIQIVASCKTAVQALERSQSHDIDIALIDLETTKGPIDGLDLVLELMKNRVHPKIMLMSSSCDPDIVIEAIAAGVHSYLLKHDYRNIVQTIRSLHVNQTGFSDFIGETLRRQIVKMKREEYNQKLSEKDKELLSYYAQGYSYEEIAEMKTMELQSIKNNFYRIKKKLGWDAKNYRNLAEKAKRWELI